MSLIKKMQENAIRDGEAARLRSAPLSSNPHDPKAHGSLAPYWTEGWKRADKTMVQGR